MNARKPVIIAILLLACWLLSLHAFQIGARPQRPARSAILSVGLNERTFLILTDIHFDPFTGAGLGEVEMLAASPVEKWQAILQASASVGVSPGGGDTDYALLVSALNGAHDSGAPYDYILVTGDYLGHNFANKYREFRPDGQGYQQFVIKTLIFLNRMIQQSFPNIPMFAALGNNDSANGDYAPAGKPLLMALSKEWKTVAGKSEATKDFISGGYYAVAHPTVPSQEFIVLNTTLWSRLFTDTASPGSTDAGSAEMNWLASTLDEVRTQGRTAALIMHIPPGIDAYSSSKEGTCRTPTLFWKKPYLDSFLAIIRSHKQSLRDSYAGHTHINDFRVFDDAAGIPYFQTNIAPSLSPDHHNPEFEVGVYDKQNGSLVDYAIFYLKNSFAPGPSGESDWEPAYDFRGLSYFPSYSPASLQTIALLIRSSDAIRSKLLDLFATRMPAALSISAKDWLTYSCAQTEATPAAFNACSCPMGSTRH
jgi:sphingomyelin phosphodiesterase acid-like 3